MSTQGLSKDILEQLQCPVYMQYMLPHITLCGNGHNICSSCKQKIQNVQPAENHFQIHGIGHWKNWLYQLSVLAQMNHTDAHSRFLSPPYVNTRTCVNTVLQYVLYDSSLTADGRGI